jgi:hypothetical protein
MIVGNDLEKIEKCSRLGGNMLEFSNDLRVLRTQWSQAKALVNGLDQSA